MKHTGLVLITLILVGGLVFASGCIAAPQNQSPEGSWILTETGSGSTAEDPTGIISMEIAGTNVSGNAGVNLYHGTITFENGKVTFSPMTTTRMAGSENMMTQEESFLAALQNVTGYTPGNDVLTLTDASGNTLLTFAAMPAKTLDATSWTLADNSKVTLEFTNGAFSGKAPVNNYFGSWYVTGTNGITLDATGTTLMAGPEDQMKAETTFFAALGNVTGYKSADGKLLLTDKDGKIILTFNRAMIEPVGIVSGNWTLSTDKNVTLSFGADGAFNGQAPVNLYFGTVTLNGDFLSLGTIGATKMAGSEDQMKAETAFFAALNSVIGYKAGEGMLEFTDKDGKTVLTFVQSVETPTISAKVLPGVDKTGLVNEWVLADNSEVTLNLTSDGRFNGQAPMNLYFGSYIETTDCITFGAVGSTMMAGSEDQMNAESEFFTALGDVAGYKVVDGRLFLTDAAGNTVLTFE